MEDESTRMKPEDERTRLKGSAPERPAPPASDERTRIQRPEADERTRLQRREEDERTRLQRPGRGESRNAEATRILRRASAEAASAPGSTGPATSGTAGTGRAGASVTGSDWQHPERWEARHEGPLGPGSVVKDRFVLESVLGQGGMGVVFRAIDRRKEEARDRDPYVAIKILGEEFRKHPNALIALQREARKAQTLAHPNVITVHDFDRDGTTVYMTMELLDGEPLNRVIAENKLRGLPPDEALSIVRGAAAALAYAHAKGIVHSDFKPGNVFLTRDREVKVLDFGIARAVQTRHEKPGDQTAFDVGSLGALTPSYASPEMLEGKEPVPADDVYALAVVAYELLTGRHPFDKTPADEARDAGMKPPALALKRRQRRALAKALSFEREKRHVDAAAFLRDLDGPSPLRKAAYAATLVAMASVAGYAVYYGNQLRPEIPFAELPPEVRAQFEEAVSEGERALGFGAIGLNDALEYFSRAYALHRNNPLAIAGLEDVADGFLRSMQEADASTKRNVIKKLYCQEYLATYSPVVDACRSTLGTASCSVTALGCPVVDDP